MGFLTLRTPSGLGFIVVHTFSLVLQKISLHLTPPQHIHLKHKIKLSGNCPAGTTCYDFVVDVPSPLQKDLECVLDQHTKKPMLVMN
jgi:hypothetical protein